MSEITVEKVAKLASTDRFVVKMNSRWDWTTDYSTNGLVSVLVQDQHLKPADAVKFVKSQQYLILHGLEFRPGEPDVTVNEYGKCVGNTWTPPTLTPAEAPFPRWTRLVEFLTADTNAGADPEAVQWFWNWLAQKVQNPARVSMTAPVFSTRQGGGKETLFIAIRHMLGHTNCDKVSVEALNSVFNKKWAQKVLIMGDEVEAGEHITDISDKLKLIIGNPEIELQAKGRDQKSIRNHLSWLFASNKAVPVKLDAADRRYSVFVNMTKIAFDGEYRATLRGMYEDGKLSDSAMTELRGMYHFLLNYKVDHTLAETPFVNAARERLIHASLASHEDFFAEVKEHGADPFLDALLEDESGFKYRGKESHWDFGDSGVARDVLYAAYRLYCKDSGRKPLGKNRFLAEAEVHDWTKARPQVPGDKARVWCMKVPRGETRRRKTRVPGPVVMSA